MRGANSSIVDVAHTVYLKRSRRDAIAAVCRAMVEQLEKRQLLTTIAANFTGGNGAASADQYAGTSGGGWAGAWGTSTSHASLSGTVTSSSPINGGGNYLQMTFTGSGGNPRAAASRGFSSTGDVSTTGKHKIEFDFRGTASLSSFTATDDAFVLFGDTAARSQIGTTNTWVVRVRGATSGGVNSKVWAFQNGDPASSGGLVDTGITLAQNTVYHFTITVDPANKTYSATISDGISSFSSSGMSFRTTGTTSSYFEAGVEASNNGESNAFSIDSLHITPVAPSAPSNLTATPGSSSQINLSWTDNSSNESGFNVERSPDGSTGWTQITTTAANATSYSSTSLAEGTRYYYRVRATNDGGDSAYTTTANAITVLNAPTGFSVSAVGVMAASLGWTDNSGAAETKFEMQYDENSSFSSPTSAADTAANAVSAIIGSLRADTTYYFRVRAANATTTSSWAMDSADIKYAYLMSNYFTNNSGVTYALTTGGSENGGPLTVGEDANLDAVEDVLRQAIEDDYQTVLLDVEWLTGIQNWDGTPFTGTTRALSEHHIAEQMEMMETAHAYLRDHGRTDIQVSFYTTSDREPACAANNILFLAGVDYQTSIYDDAHDMLNNADSDKNVDFVVPYAYTLLNDLDADLSFLEKWAKGVQIQLDAYPTILNRDLPIIPFVAPLTQVAGEQTLTMLAGQFAEELSFLRGQTDGVIVWGSDPATSTSANGWWAGMQKLVATATATPATPSNVTLNTNGMHLTWNIPSSTTTPTGYLVTRTSDGLKFLAPVLFDSSGDALTTQGWTDPHFHAGTSYTYTVKAIAGGGESAASSAVSGTAARDATSYNYASEFDDHNPDLYGHVWRYDYLDRLDRRTGFVTLNANGAYTWNNQGMVFNDVYFPTSGVNQLQMDIYADHDVTVQIYDQDPWAGQGVGEVNPSLTPRSSFVVRPGTYPMKLHTFSATGMWADGQAHDLYFNFTTSDPLLNDPHGAEMRWFRFTKNEAPASPTNLTATYQAGSSAVTLSWILRGDDATGYYLEKSTTADFASYTPITINDPDAATYVDTSPPVNTDEESGILGRGYYRIRAFNTHGSSSIREYASPVIVSTATSGTPVTVSATVINSTQVLVDWSAVANASQYIVARRYEGGGGTNPDPLPAGITSYIDTPDTMQGLYYVILPIGSGYYNAQGYLTTPKTAPSRRIVYNTDRTGVELMWFGGDGQSYTIEYSTDSSFATGAKTMTVPGTCNTAYVAGLDAGTQYYFHIRANGSSYTSSVTTTTDAPATPAGFAVTSSSIRSTNVGVTWSASVGVTGYAIDISTNNFSSYTTQTAAAGATSKTLTGLSPVTTYQFRIRATGGNVNSANSSSITARTTANAPGAVDIAQDYVTLAWDSFDPNDVYDIYRSTDHVNWMAVTNVNVGNGGTDWDADPAAVYYYKIFGYSNNDWSDESEPVYTLAPASPYGGYATVDGSDVTLAWGDPDVPRILYFNVYRGATEDFTINSSNLIGDSFDRTAAYIDTGVSPGTYYYKVTAVYSILGGTGTLESEGSAAFSAVVS